MGNKQKTTIRRLHIRPENRFESSDFTFRVLIVFACAQPNRRPIRTANGTSSADGLEDSFLLLKSNESRDVSPKAESLSLLAARTILKRSHTYKGYKEAAMRSIGLWSNRKGNYSGIRRRGDEVAVN